MQSMYSDVAEFQRDPLSFLLERGSDTTDPLVPLALGRRPMYLLTDPSYIKPLLKIPEDTVDKGPGTRRTRVLIGDNVVTLVGAEQRRRRAAVHSVVARPTVERLTGVLANEVRSAIEEVSTTQTFDARDFGANVALRLLSVVAFGVNVLSPAEKTCISEIIDQALADLGNMVFRATPPAPWTWLAERRRLARARNTMQQIVRNVRERAPDSVAVRAYGALQLSGRETSDELMTLILAGHHTTGFAAAWLLHALATVPGLTDRIAAEAEAVRDENGEIDVGRLRSAETSLAAAREVLRLYPSIQWLRRGVRRDFELAGRTLRRGSTIMLSPWLFHRSPRFWEAPDEFRVDRAYDTSAYVPFGNGPRMCVGMNLAMLELQIIALEMASSLRLVVTGPVDAPKPLLNLTPPVIRMQAHRRSATSASSGPFNTKPIAAEPDGKPRVECPFHVQRP